MIKNYKALKLIILSAALYLIFLLGNAVYMFTKGHKVEVKVNSKNNWFFTDSNKIKLDSISSIYYTKRDILFNFNYELDNKMIFIDFWKINDLQKMTLKDLKINFDVNLNKEKEPVEYEILDNKGDFSIVVKYDYDFERGFNLNFPKSDSIVFYESKKELKYVYGKFDFISITNGKNEEQIVFRNIHSNNFIAFFIFRKHRSNYLAIVHSDYYFGEKIAKIFTFYK